MAFTWEELEEPVLWWVHEHGDEGTGEIEYNDTTGSKVPGVPQNQLDVALRRLCEFGLIKGERIEATWVQWTWARPTADGLRLLAEWPPPPSTSVNELLAYLVGRVAEEQLEGEEASVARRVAGRIGGGAKTTVADAVKGELSRSGEETVS